MGESDLGVNEQIEHNETAAPWISVHEADTLGRVPRRRRSRGQKIQDAQNRDWDQVVTGRGRDS